MNANNSALMMNPLSNSSNRSNLEYSKGDPNGYGGNGNFYGGQQKKGPGGSSGGKGPVLGGGKGGYNNEGGSGAGNQRNILGKRSY